MTCPLLSIIVLAKENTSFAFRHMMDCLQKQTVSPLQIMVVDVNTPGDPYSLSLQPRYLDDSGDPEHHLLQIRQVRW